MKDNTKEDDNNLDIKKNMITEQTLSKKCSLEQKAQQLIGKILVVMGNYNQEHLVGEIMYIRYRVSIDKYLVISTSTHVLLDIDNFEQFVEKGETSKGDYSYLVLDKPNGEPINDDNDVSSNLFQKTQQLDQKWLGCISLNNSLLAHGGLINSFTFSYNPVDGEFTANIYFKNDIIPQINLTEARVDCLLQYGVFKVHNYIYYLLDEEPRIVR